MKTLGPSTVVQAAVPGIIQNVPVDYHERNISILQVCINDFLIHVNVLMLCSRKFELFPTNNF